MLPALAQLDCAVEVIADDVARTPPPAAAEGPRAGAVGHFIEFRDALTGSHGRGRRRAAAVSALASGAPLRDEHAESSPDGAVLLRVWTLPPSGASYALRVDGSASRRYFGCEREVPTAGPASRRVRVSLVPRARDVTVAVAVRRGSSARELSAAGLRWCGAAPVRPGRARGGGSPRALLGRAARDREPLVRPVARARARARSSLAASAPGHGLAALTLDVRSTERTVALTAGYEGHLMPSATIRVGAAWAPLGGGGVGVLASLDVLAGSSLHGQTCPLADTCVRPVMRLGAGNLPYARTTTLVGPGDAARRDGEVGGDLGVVEVGGGVTVVPAGTGDSLRFTLVASGVLGIRGDELLQGTETVLSPATTRFGAAAELYAAWRFLGPLLLHAGARLQGFPSFGGTGRRFSFLGDAPLAGDSASLLQVAVFAGIGVEP
ncbi:MAG: hypothetical protein U0324_16990 [Polyangiales bacterium]